MPKKKAKRFLGELKPMPVRSASELRTIRNQEGGTILAALKGKVNAEEYLRLEALSEH